MASAQSLLGLMTQLQNLESNVASILIEASLKLCSLTDINVFFLVETADGRRFAGTPQFCDGFRRGGLLAADSDIECVVNPAISALEERGLKTGRGIYPPASRPGLHHRQTPPHASRNGFHGFETTANFSHSTSFNRKRSMPLTDASSRPIKNFRPSVVSANKSGTTKATDGGDVSGDVIGEKNGGADAGGGVTNVSGVGSDLALDLFDTEESSDALLIDVKAEEEESRATTNHDAGADDSFTHFDVDDDDIVEVPLSDRSSSRVHQDTVDPSSSNANDSFHYKNWQLATTSSFQHRQHQQQLVPVGPPVMDFINDVYPRSLLDKLEALESFEVEVIFDPAAAPRKVLNSILHEVGTKLATSCPYWPRHLSNPQLKEWLISNIEVFIGKFPVMQRICDDRHKVFIGKKAMSKLTYVKNNIRSSYDKQFKSNPKDSNDFGQVLA